MDFLPINHGDFPVRYVKLPEGTFKYSRQLIPSVTNLRIFIIFIRTQPRFPRVSEHVCSSPWYLGHEQLRFRLRLLDESSPVFVDVISSKTKVTQNPIDIGWSSFSQSTCRKMEISGISRWQTMDKPSRFGDFGYLPVSNKPLYIYI